MEMGSSSEYESLHFVLLPHLAHGHLIPMIDMARLLSLCGITVTVITTPLNGVCAGVPMVTWPMFAEQFYNEKMIIQVLKIGVSLGPEFSIKWGEEDKFGAVVKRETVEKAITELMGEVEEAQRRRTRAIELGVKAKEAMEERGSSFLNLTLLIEDIKQHLPLRSSQHPV